MPDHARPGVCAGASRHPKPLRAGALPFAGALDPFALGAGCG